jgi:hypothetical protein
LLVTNTYVWQNSSLEECESKPQNTEEVKHPSVDNSEKELIRHKRKFDEISIQKDDEKSNKYDGFNHINSLDDDSDFSRAVEILLEVVSCFTEHYTSTQVKSLSTSVVTLRVGKI